MSSEVLKSGYTWQWCKLRLYLKELTTKLNFQSVLHTREVYDFALMHVRLNKM